MIVFNKVKPFSQSIPTQPTSMLETISGIWKKNINFVWRTICGSDLVALQQLENVRKLEISTIPKKNQL